MTRDWKHPDELYVKCLKPTKDCNLIQDNGLGDVAGELMIDYRYSKAASKKTAYKNLDGKQRNSAVRTNKLYAAVHMGHEE